eukprot:48773-Eustigmatos_ZCMA.PRE.1
MPPKARVRPQQLTRLSPTLLVFTQDGTDAPRLLRDAGRGAIGRGLHPIVTTRSRAHPPSSRR